MKNEGLEPRFVEDLKPSFCLFDHRMLLIRLENPDGGTVIQDESIAEMFKQRFEELYARARPVEDEKVAS